MNVYLVTSGEYSDFHIDAAFSTSELAEAHVLKIREMDGCDSPNVEEWAVDSECEAEVKTVYQAVLNLSDGSLRWNAETDRELVGPGEGDAGTVYANPTGHDSQGTVVGRSVKSPEHALKLAVEARQAFLREQAEPKA